MSSAGEFGNPLRKFKLVFLGEQSGECFVWDFDVNRVEFLSDVKCNMFVRELFNLRPVDGVNVIIPMAC